MPTGDYWLASMIDTAVRTNCCLRVNCSTCESTPFRRALWAAAGFAAPLLPEEEIADQLAALPPAVSTEAIRLVIHELYRRVGSAGLDLLAKGFAETPAGEELNRMRAHSRSVGQRRDENAYQNSPAYGEQRKAERAAWHAERLAQRAARDAARRHEGPS